VLNHYIDQHIRALLNYLTHCLIRVKPRPGCTHYAEIFALQRPALDRVEEEEPCASFMINLMTMSSSVHPVPLRLPLFLELH
jgi:hypothetical protein